MSETEPHCGFISYEQMKTLQYVSHFSPIEKQSLQNTISHFVMVIILKVCRHLRHPISPNWSETCYLLNAIFSFFLS